MKTDSELEGIATNFHYGANSFHFHEWLPSATKLLRSIQIDALRHAREIIDTGYDDGIESQHYNLERMDLLIRELELR